VLAQRAAAMPPFTSVALTGFLIQSGPSLHMPPSTMATISGLVMPLRGAALAMQDDGNSSARRAALSGFAKAAAVVTLTDVALDVVEQVTGALPDARQAATQRKEAVANAKRLAKVAQQDRQRRPAWSRMRSRQQRRWQTLSVTL